MGYMIVRHDLSDFLKLLADIYKLSRRMQPFGDERCCILCCEDSVALQLFREYRGLPNYYSILMLEMRTYLYEELDIQTAP